MYLVPPNKSAGKTLTRSEPASRPKGSRWCHGPGNGNDTITASKPDQLQVDRRADNELGPGQEGYPAGFGIKDRTGPDYEIIPISTSEFLMTSIPPEPSW